MLFVSCSTGLAIADEYMQKRQQMIADIEAYVETTVKYTKKDTFDEQVMQAMSTTPRHEFVPEEMRDSAYENQPLPIGYGQTISQPYIVALMTQLLQPQSDQRVLEIGTGSGYQAAVLARLVPKVYTVERIEPLARQARQRFRKLGLRNIRASYSDGTEGLPEFAPYDAIITTAAAETIPQALLEQLSPDGGRLVIPVGGRACQTLTVVTRNGDKFEQQELDPVVFVPLLSGQA